MGICSLTAREPVFNKKKNGASVLVTRCNKIGALKRDTEFLKYCYVNILLSRENLNYSTQSSVRRISTEIALYKYTHIYVMGFLDTRVALALGNDFSRN